MDISNNQWSKVREMKGERGSLDRIQLPSTAPPEAPICTFETQTTAYYHFQSTSSVVVPMPATPVDDKIHEEASLKFIQENTIALTKAQHHRNTSYDGISKQKRSNEIIPNSRAKSVTNYRSSSSDRRNSRPYDRDRFKKIHSSGEARSHREHVPFERSSSCTTSRTYRSNPTTSRPDKDQPLRSRSRESSQKLADDRKPRSHEHYSRSHSIRASSCSSTKRSDFSATTKYSRTESFSTKEKERQHPRSTHRATPSSRAKRVEESPRSRSKTDRGYSTDIAVAEKRNRSSDTRISKSLRKCSDAEKSSAANEDSDEFTVDEWVRSAPADLFYVTGTNGEYCATDRTKNLCAKFEKNLLLKAQSSREEAEELGRLSSLKEEACEKKQTDKPNSADKRKGCSSSDSDSLSDESDEEISSRTFAAQKQLERRKRHPRRLHEELWHNEPGQMNDGPVCRCSAKSKRFGIRHGFYTGETVVPLCDPFSNNASRLFHYKILINPPTNLVIKSPTVIIHDDHEYLFEGFSILSHYKLDEKLPPCRIIRFNIRYCLAVQEEAFPSGFCVEELRLFETYLFREVLELVDLKFGEGGCPQFHLMPRFVRKLPDNGKEILSMNKVLQHLLQHDKPLIEEQDLKAFSKLGQSEWQDFADKHKGTIVMKRGMKPCAIRVDQIDRNVDKPVSGETQFPVIVHFGIRPPQLSYAGNAEYQRAWRRFVKYRHLLSNMPKPKIEDKRKLLERDLKLQEMRTRSTMKRDVTVDISSEGFRATGLCCDMVQHAMLIPVLVSHLRFHKSLEELENKMQYQFKNRYLLQLAMTHPSYRENFGTNPDHARNALTNCGIRQPEYGDRSIHYASSRKRGINTLIDIMARFGMKYETESEITHNERLEFLGDAVVEFVTSIHLFHIFPDLEEGGLATYRAAIVQNQHLAVLAQNLGLDRFMLYAHGSDLCHDSELRHAMANCFEALMGALFLDEGLDVWTQINVADRVFSMTMFGHEPEVWQLWTHYPRHPLQLEEPNGDRHWVKSHVVLQKLVEFEEQIGVEFNHVRLLARAFTDRSLGYNNLTRGSNQRMEFLGDTVLQLIASEYLYRHFPDHHEGHLSLLRSSLVNNRTQATVCDTLGMTAYAMRHDPKSEIKTKDRADLLEAFLGALYIDQGLYTCVVFCSVCFFPRLTESIMNQDWNDPKSKLQQCCLTLRTMDGKEPEIPFYKVTEVMGPTNTRVYKVAVYFKNRRLATSRGHSIQEAEMNAASKALVKRDYLFPQLRHQKRLLEKTTKKIVKKTTPNA